MPKRLFGTNGVRGVVNEDLTSDMALQIGKAIGTVMGGTVAIATDTRGSADLIRTAVSSGLMSVGVSVLDLGVLPTPALQYYVKTHNTVSGGVMITASHNPPQFNGIKCISRDGTEASRKEEEEIEAKYSSNLRCACWNSIGSMNRIDGAAEEYVDSIVSKVDAEAIRKAGLKVCIDCADGAAYETTPLLLKKLNVTAVAINCSPRGESPGRPFEPTEENLGELMSLTRSTGSDLGIAHDGDADRCVFVTIDGKYVSGDKSLALLAGYALSKKKGTVVTPVSSSSLVKAIVEGNGGKVVYTAVGSPVVARKMIEIGAVFGGEENGGLIFPEQQHCRDGGMSAAKMLECIVKNGPLNKQLYRFPTYHTVKKKVECPNAMKKPVMDHLVKESAGAKVDNTDGIKLLFDDGWVLARPSGTEPLFRIFSESKDEDTAKQRAEKYETLVNEFLKRGLN